MIFQLREAQVSEQSQIPLSRWLSYVWQNPLVDATTREHRRQAPKQFERFFDAIHEHIDFFKLLQPSDFFAGRLMGEVWYANPNSDHDVMIYSLDDRSAYEFHDKVSPHANKLRIDTNIDIVGAHPVIDCQDHLALIKSGLAVPLMITPDELMLGNVEAAREARLQLIDQLEAAGQQQIDRLWNDPKSPMNQFFAIRYKNWCLNPDAEGRHSWQRTDDKPREFRERLDAVARHKRLDPEIYYRTFKQLMNSFNLPSFNDYSAEVKRNRGALVMK